MRICPSRPRETRPGESGKRKRKQTDRERKTKASGRAEGRRSERPRRGVRGEKRTSALSRKPAGCRVRREAAAPPKRSAGSRSEIKRKQAGEPRGEGDAAKASGGRERKRIKATRRMLRDERDAAKASWKLQGEEHDEGQREAGRGKETERGGAARRGTRNAGGARGPEREDQA